MIICHSMRLAGSGLLFYQYTGISCFKHKESTFLHFLFNTYARPASPHHKQVSMEAPKLLAFVVLFLLHKICHYVQSVYTCYKIKCYITIIVALLDSVYCCPRKARGYLLVLLVYVQVEL